MQIICQRNIDGLRTCSEEFTGTTATSLCIFHKKPVQLVGPSNYLERFEDFIVSAAPILDRQNEVVATLGIIQVFGDFNLQKMRTHSLGWVTAMADAIANQLELKSAYQILDATLAVVDEGFITLDNNGMITNINQEACKILGVEAASACGGHYAKYLGNVPSVASVLENGTPVHDLEISVDNRNTGQNCIVNIDPVPGNEKIRFNGVIVRMNRSDKINKLLNHAGAPGQPMFSAILKGKVKNSRNVSVLPNIFLKPTPMFC